MIISTMFCINSIIKCSFAFCVLRSTAPICVNGVGKQWLRLQCVHPVDSMCLNQTSCIWSIKNIIVYVRTATTYELEACRLCASLLHYAWLPLHDFKSGLLQPKNKWHASHWTWTAFFTSKIVIFETKVRIMYKCVLHFEPNWFHQLHKSCHMVKFRFSIVTGACTSYWLLEGTALFSFYGVGIGKRWWRDFNVCASDPSSWCVHIK